MYIGIDLGTTACKCVLYWEDGTVAAEYNTEYQLILRDDFIEQDANMWWQLVHNGIRHVTKAAGVRAVRAIAISSQGISYVPVDQNGKPLANAVSWLDTRPKAEIEQIRKTFGAAHIFQTTGKKLSPCYTLPQLMWLRANNPSLYARAYKLLMPLDFLHMCLTGRAVTDYTMASGTMLFNLREKKWDSTLLAFSGIDEEKLPEILPMGAFIGNVLPDVMESLGLTGETAVYVGGQDQKLAAIGAGISEGACTVSFGTAAAVTVLNPQREYDPEMRFSSFVLNDDAWVFENSIGTAGATLKWLRNLFGTSYAVMDEEAAAAQKGAGGVSFDAKMADGASITGLTLGTTRGDFVRALYEHLCTSIRDMLVQMHAPGVIRVFGGGAKSDIWCRILAETTGAEVHALDTTETASRGAAILASKQTLAPAGVCKKYTA